MEEGKGSSTLRFLDHCLTHLSEVKHLRQILEKIEKCSLAIQKKFNLADIVTDPGNRQSLSKLFQNDFQTGLQLLTRVALQDHECLSLTLKKPISGPRKLDMLFRSLGGWRQFDMVILLQTPPSTISILNPARQKHWISVGEIPVDTVITFFIKTTQGKRSRSQEKLALERAMTVFDTIQNISDSAIEKTPQVIKLEPRKTQAQKPAVKSSTKKFSSSVGSKFQIRNGSSMAPGASSSTPVMSFKVVVNKMDTFVHAGNAQLILTHIREYAGRVEMGVQRDKKYNINLDADSIWSAEARNGETVIFDFFGPKPSEEFLKELAKKVNKYTQMDKLVNE